MNPEDEATQQSIIQAAQVGLVAMLTARDIWRQKAPRAVRGALDPEGRGRVYPDTAMRRGVDAVLAENVRRMTAAGVAYKETKNLLEFAMAMAEGISLGAAIAYLSAYSLLVNDPEFADDTIIVGTELLEVTNEQSEEQADYLIALLILLAGGKTLSLISPRLFGQAGRGLYHLLEMIGMKKRGYNWEARVLGAAEHCPDCVSYANREWMPIGTLPAPTVGSRCRSNCKCRKVYSASVERPTHIPR